MVSLIVSFGSDQKKLKKLARIESDTRNRLCQVIDNMDGTGTLVGEMDSPLAFSLGFETARGEVAHTPLGFR